MQRFYFHLSAPDQDFPDNIGSDVTDLAAAHSIAVRLMKRVMMISAFADCAPDLRRWTVKVTDERRRPVFTVLFPAYFPPRNRSSCCSNREGFNVYTTDLGEEGIDLGKVYDYDIILLDLNLPDMSGFEVLRSLRVSKVKTPILILSGLPGIEDKVRGFGFGADDYMTKLFHKDELVARLHAIVRRSKSPAQSVIQTGDLVVNLDTKTVEVNGARVHLTGKEYQMLELLSLRKGTTLTKEMFLNHLYGGMDEPALKIFDVFICKLRKKLVSASNGKNYIETVWGRGYALRDPVDDPIADTA